ncbi:HAMP domain-containing sensor histidine kinase [Caldibacillus thermoamylovorans]|jgi:signal transduction histidine kinase|nr:HAMP domain-containing sensor histidine kinase [Caldibacillus thermoamylovorans]
MKLKNKINLYTSVLFIGLLIFMNITIYLLFKNLMVASEISATEQEFDNTTAGVISSLGTVATDNLLRAYVPIDGKIQLVASDGKNLAMSVSPSEEKLSKQETAFYDKEVTKEITLDENHYYFYSLPVVWTDGSIANLQVTKSIETAYDQSETLRFILFAVTFVATIPIIVSSQLLGKLIMDPITALTKTMKEITKSGQFKRIPMNQQTKDELEQMGKSFNHMIDLLETNFTKQEQFVSNASHELRTPLTVIESYASLLKRRGIDKPEIFHEAVDAIHAEAVRMREMTEQLLLLAKPNEQWNLDFRSLSLTLITEATTKSFEQAYGREIALNVTEEVVVISDEQKLKQLLYIILENAVKYSEEIITVTIGKQNKEGFIRVSDKGIGIPEEDLPKIFDRFYRVDQARSRKYGGTGLGLSLAKEIANAIHAKIEVESSLGAGTNVTIRLPLQ